MQQVNKTIFLMVSDIVKKQEDFGAKPFVKK